MSAAGKQAFLLPLLAGGGREWIGLLRVNPSLRAGDGIDGVARLGWLRC